jgi:hypothetical protein
VPWAGGRAQWDLHLCNLQAYRGKWFRKSPVLSQFLWEHPPPRPPITRPGGLPNAKLLGTKDLTKYQLNITKYCLTVAQLPNTCRNQFQQRHFLGINKDAGRGEVGYRGVWGGALVPSGYGMVKVEVLTFVRAVTAWAIHTALCTQTPTLPQALCDQPASRRYLLHKKRALAWAYF